jgi:predicted dehydrogenase
MNATVRWGILGCGDVAEKKGGPALYKAEGSALTAVMRRDRAKAEDFARRHGAARVYDRAEDLLADGEVDAVYIATPPNLHCEQTIAAARAGKHVLVEKPMALDAGECDRMIAACREAGVNLHVAYYRRFYPKFVAAKKMLDEGAVGRVLGGRLLMCSYSPGGGWRVDPAVSGGGHFVDVGSHRLDMLLHLLGDGEAVDASGYAENLIGAHAAENDVVLSLRTASGAVASASFHFQTHPGRDVMEVYGDTGSLLFDAFDGPAFVLRRRGAAADETFTYETPDPVHLPFIQALVGVYHGADTSHVTGEEGARATRIMDAALSGYRAHSSGGGAVAAK